MFASPMGTRYLRCDFLQPSDVILTRSRRKRSGVVAAATKGPYSHAAIVVLRHPSLRDACPPDFERRVPDAVVDYSAKQYPNLDALRFAACDSPLAIPIVGALLCRRFAPQPMPGVR